MSPFFRFIQHTTLAIALLCAPTHNAFAWGERGHDLITRVAVRLCPDRGGDPAFCKMLATKEHMLGHLSNVPDIVWKNTTRAIAEANDPTHYIDLEFLVKGKPSLTNIPRTFAEASHLAAEAHVDLLKDVGTVPWRVNQLAAETIVAWKDVTQARSRVHGNARDTMKNVLEQPVNHALLLAGITSHFIGDLTMPFHVSADHDGYDMGQGGIHAWYETAVLNALPLDLDGEIFTHALKDKPFDAIAALLKKAKLSPSDPLDIAWGLAIRSNAKIPQVLKIDKDTSMLKASSKVPQKTPADRKPVVTVMEYYRASITEDLALGADTLIHLWILEWEKGGKPPLREYQSWNYPYAPDFIPVDYGR